VLAFDATRDLTLTLDEDTEDPSAIRHKRSHGRAIINGSLKLYRERVQVCKQARGESCQKHGGATPQDLILRPPAIPLIFKTRNARLPLGARHAHEK